MLQKNLETLVREILSDSYVSLEIEGFSLTENVKEQSATIAAVLTNKRDGGTRAVEGQGVGMVDALFTGLKLSLSSDYPSLEHIHFVDFKIASDFDQFDSGSRSDAALRVCLAVENHSGRRFEFHHSSRSITGSCSGAVVECVEHFVNAELAVLRVHDWIADARVRRRQDLVDKYIQRLADLVKNSSYSESIERSRTLANIRATP